MRLKLHYDLGADRVLNDALFAHDSAVMHRAHVEKLYLFGYFYGTWESSLDKVCRAAERLRAEGFEAEIVHVPFGHGGNALNPDDPSISLTCGEGWRQRRDAQGRICETTTCPNAKCIVDTRAVNDALAERGFHEIFLDDDCRLGTWGAQMQGCFCEDCLSRFAEKTGKRFTREQIAGGDAPLREAWMDFQSDSLVAYLVGIKPRNAKLGVMVMQNGDRRHGIDIPKMRRAIPDLFFRVGECHFGDKAMQSPTAKEEITASIHTHMALGGGQANCWSESTVYPMGDLSPENWILKMQWEIEAGLRQLYLMSGTAFFPDCYWDALADAYPTLLAMSEAPEPEHRVTEFIWK